MTHITKISELFCFEGLPFGEPFAKIISEGEGAARAKGDEKMRNYKFTENFKFSTETTMGKLEGEIINKIHNLSKAEAKIVNKEAWKQSKTAINGTYETNNMSDGKHSLYWSFVYDHNICEQVKKETYKVMMGYV